MRNYKKIKSLPQVPENISKKIFSDGFITGSYAWGYSSPFDIDIVLPPGFNKNMVATYGYCSLVDWLRRRILRFDFSTIYVLIDNKIHHLLFVKNQDVFDRWYEANQKMNNIVNKNREYFSNKTNRVLFFRWLRTF